MVVHLLLIKGSMFSTMDDQNKRICMGKELIGIGLASLLTYLMS